MAGSAESTHHHHRFYDLLQMGVGELKGHIRRAGDTRERRRLIAGLVVRDLAIIVFAVFFISGMTAAFGQIASSAAVACFVMLLCLRFVGFSFSNRHNLLALAVAFGILTAAPLLSAGASIWVRAGINLVSLSVLFILCVQDPRMGNAGVYGFCYTFLVGSLYDRTISPDDASGFLCSMALGFAVCAFALHRNRSRTAQDGSISGALRRITLSDPVFRFQLRAACGITLAFLCAQAIGLPRIMWVGLAVSSLLTPYGLKPIDRIGWRIGFTVFGCAVFAVLFPALPLGVQGLLGIAAGLGCGLCSKYQWSQIFNSLGALLTAAPLLGVAEAPIVRVIDNVFGCAFALVFAWLFSLLVRRFENAEAAASASGN